MYINYSVVHGIEYARVCESYRDGKTIRKRTVLYLGRVIDREKGIFRNRELGLISYDPASGTITGIPADCVPAETAGKNSPGKRRARGLSFGDVYLVDEFIKACGFKSVLEATGYGDMDGLYAAVLYYVVQRRANCRARDWWETSYAGMLCPGAEPGMQRFDEMLADIGQGEVIGNFFSAYHRFLNGGGTRQTHGDPGKAAGDGILIDRTGFPHCSRLPCTAVSNRSGEIQEEVRLLYAVQRRTGLPLFYRYVPGGDADTFVRGSTVQDLRDSGVSLRWALVEDGCGTAPGADAWVEENIPLITEVGANQRIFKEAVSRFRGTLVSPDNIVIHNKHMYHIVETPCATGGKKGRKAYGYLCLDESRYMAEQRAILAEAGDSGPIRKETVRDLNLAGVFMLVSTRRIDRGQIPALYFAGDQIEEIFELSRQYAQGIPFCSVTEQVFQGHLLLTFIAAVIHRLLADALSGTGCTPQDVIAGAHDVQCLVHDGELRVNAVPEHVAAHFQQLNIPIPDSIPLSTGRIG